VGTFNLFKSGSKKLYLIIIFRKLVYINLKKMKKIFLVLALTAALSFSGVTAAAEVDEGVLVLTDANFDEELVKYDNLLVEFYAPWW